MAEEEGVVSSSCLTNFFRLSGWYYLVAHHSPTRLSALSCQSFNLNSCPVVFASQPSQPNCRLPLLIVLKGLVTIKPFELLETIGFLWWDSPWEIYSVEVGMNIFFLHGSIWRKDKLQEENHVNLWKHKIKNLVALFFYKKIFIYLSNKNEKNNNPKMWQGVIGTWVHLCTPP